MNPSLVLRKRVKKIGRQKNKDNRKFRLYKIQIVYTGRALEMLAFHKWDTFGMLYITVQCSSISGFWEKTLRQWREIVFFSSLCNTSRWDGGCWWCFICSSRCDTISRGILPHIVNAANKRREKVNWNVPCKCTGYLGYMDCGKVLGNHVIYISMSDNIVFIRGNHSMLLFLVIFLSQSEVKWRIRCEDKYCP